MTTFYVCAGIGILIMCGFSYALGHRNGRIDGWNDGYEYRARECKARCEK